MASLMPPIAQHGVGLLLTVTEYDEDGHALREHTAGVDDSNIVIAAIKAVRQQHHDIINKLWDAELFLKQRFPVTEDADGDPAGE